MNRKGLKTMTEELKQRMFIKSVKRRRYEQRIEQFRENRIFDFNQKKMDVEFNEGGVKTNDVPNGEENKRFCGDIRSIGKGHKQEAG